MKPRGDWTAGCRPFVTADLILIVLAAALLIAAFLRTPWHRFRSTGFQHVFLGACVAVLFLWRIRVGIIPAMPIHLLCLTTLTLMFGVPLAILAAAILTTAMNVMGLDGWQSWGANLLALGVVPISVTWLALRASRRYFPRNPFIYIFVGAFFGAAAAMLASMASLSLLLLGLEQVPIGQPQGSYLSILPLMMFPEAFVNGLVVTGLVVFKPAWIPS